MKTFKKILSLLLLTSLVKADDCCEKYNFYLMTESGWSWSNKANICADTSFWDEANEGYNSKLGRGYVASAEVGVFFNNWLSLGSSYNFRGIYEYCKNQTSDAVDTPAFIGNKRRRFDLTNTSFMYTMGINRGYEPCWSWECGCFSIAPFIAGGIGISFNNLYNFHSITDKQIPGFDNYLVRSVETGFIKRSFAWQVSAGIEAAYSDRMAFGVSYRYFDGGKFYSNNYLNPEIDNQVDPDACFMTAPRWRGRLRTNELLFNLMINF